MVIRVLLASKSLNNELCLGRPIFIIDLNPNKFHLYPFMVSLDRCNGVCKILDDPSDRISVSNKLGDANVNVFNMVTRINESRTLTKRILCDCKCRFDGRKCNSNQKWNNSKCRCECKNPIKHRLCKNYYV